MSARHCCERMQAQVEQRCPDHPDRHDCPDALISHVSKYREYGLIIHDDVPAEFEDGTWLEGRTGLDVD
jgi:hypothetical protein